jgi:putative ABC transport system permease protein
VAVIVPRERRDEWKREWDAELWHFLAGHDSGKTRAAFPLAWRTIGSLPHALWIRRNDWRTEMIAQDLLFAVRGVIRRPAFAALVVVTLGLGIGVNTAMFTVVNSVLIQPLPYRQSDQLVFMYGSFSKFDRAAVSPPDFLDYRERNTVFESFAAQRLIGTSTITGDGEPERISSTSVTANYFSTLGVSPVRGRAFLPAEEEGGGHDVVVLSYGLWQRRFGGDPAILTRSITVDGRARRIVGVMSPVLDRTLSVQLWQPLQFHTPETQTRRFHFLRAIGRLKPGVTIGQAQAAMDVVAKQLEAAYPENATWHLNLLPYRDVVIGNVGRALLILLGAVGLVLLIACGNVASLLLARASSRQGEIAIRTALGASRTRLVRQLLTESLLLAIGGGIVGLLLATLLLRALRVLGTGILPRLNEVGIDATVLGFTIGLSVLTGLIFGVAPAIHAVRDNLVTSLASLGRNSGARGTVRARDALVVAQVALSLVLLVGAGLTVRSLWKLQHVPPGFDPTNVLTAEVFLPEQRYRDRAAQLLFWQSLNDKLHAITGASEVSMTTMLPLRGGGDTRYWVDGEPRVTETARNAQINVVGDRYFETMRIPVTAGRVFTRDDRSGPNTIVINRSMANRIFPNEGAVGKRLAVDFGGDPFVGEIVGVVGDVSAFGLDVAPPDVFYFSIHQSGGFGRGYMNVVLRTARNPTALMAPLRAAVAALDRDIALSNVRSMSDIVDASTSRQRFAARLLTGFALTALGLAIIGLYGVLAYIVAQRTRELGIRIALGAPRTTVFGLIVRRGMTVVALGLVIGIGAALLATRLIDRLLFQVGTTDPLVFIVVPVSLAAAALIACLVPARQAMRVDPIVALRSES